jgi:hypothetical protein
MGKGQSLWTEEKEIKIAISQWPKFFKIPDVTIAF